MLCAWWWIESGGGDSRDFLVLAGERLFTALCQPQPGIFHVGAVTFVLCLCKSWRSGCHFTAGAHTDVATVHVGTGGAWPPLEREAWPRRAVRWALTNANRPLSPLLSADSKVGTEQCDKGLFIMETCHF